MGDRTQQRHRLQQEKVDLRLRDHDTTLEWLIFLGCRWSTHFHYRWIGISRQPENEQLGIICIPKWLIIPRQDHVYRITFESFRFHNNEFDQMRRELDPIENPRSFDKYPTPPQEEYFLFKRKLFLMGQNEPQAILIEQNAQRQI